MDTITGWATKMMMKQKMGNVADSLPGMGKEEPPKKTTSKEMRQNIKALRAERDAEHEAKKANTKKLSMADRWAKNKAGN